MRTIIDLPDEQLRALDAVRKRLGISRAEAVRRALRLYLAQEPQREAARDPAFGLWARYPDDPVTEMHLQRDDWDERIEDLLRGATRQ